MTGARVSGALHIGHYFGVTRNMVSFQDEYDCFYGVMDWHGMTTSYRESHKIDLWIRDMLSEWVAWGIDPEKATVFVQSQVPEVLELNMIFANLTPLGWLERVPTWKDAVEDAKKNDTHNLGRFGYPVLQAADIAIFQGERVPIGKDQAPHLELSREIIRRFNGVYKGKFPEPKPIFTETPMILGLDNRKMSTSYGNTIELSQEPKAVERAVKKMITDPQRVTREDKGDPEVCNVYSFHKLVSSKEEQAWVREGCTTAGIGCGDCKMKLACNINNLFEEPREKKKKILADRVQMDRLIKEGSEKAREVAQKTLRSVRDAMKFHGGL